MNPGGMRFPFPDESALERAADLALFGRVDRDTKDADRGRLDGTLDGAFDGAFDDTFDDTFDGAFDAHLESLERAVAIVATDERLARAAGAIDAGPPPAALLTRLHALAARPRADMPAPRSTEPAAPPEGGQPRPPLARIGAPRRDWLVAAASVAFGAAATLALLEAGRARDASEAPDPAAFLAAHPAAIHWPWTPTSDGHVVAPVAGEAYFDPTTGDGLLVIDGLAPNDPRAEQYQLWIFDERRDERYPVDGGVFDVPASGHAVVPIHAKLAVARPTLLAVTVERPGGVVVSERRIALLARP